MEASSCVAARCQWKDSNVSFLCVSGIRSHSTNSSTSWWGSSSIRLRRPISRSSKTREWFGLVGVMVTWERVSERLLSSLQVKVAILKYIECLARQMDPTDFVNSSETRLAVSRIITWTTEPKSSDVRKVGPDCQRWEGYFLYCNRLEMTIYPVKNVILMYMF